jgi:hypothetical protein
VITSVGETSASAGHFGETDAPGQYDPSADLVRDGIVDGRDVSLLDERKAGACAGK